MKRVGITGTIGSGKSFVGALLRERGFMVMDADREVHELYRDNQELRSELAAAFGEACLALNGVNRKFVADLVFNDAVALKKLEGIVYPYLTRSVGSFLNGGVPENAPQAQQVRFVEAALLSRTPGILQMLDEVWIVDAPKSTRLRRLVARGLEPADARRRIENQRETCKADLFTGKVVCTLTNEGDVASLQNQLDALL